MFTMYFLLSLYLEGPEVGLGWVSVCIHVCLLCDSRYHCTLRGPKWGWGGCLCVYMYVYYVILVIIVP